MNVETLGFSKWVIVKPTVKVSGEPHKTHDEGFWVSHIKPMEMVEGEPRKTLSFD